MFLNILASLSCQQIHFFINKQHLYCINQPFLIQKNMLLFFFLRKVLGDIKMICKNVGRRTPCLPKVKTNIR